MAVADTPNIVPVANTTAEDLGYGGLFIALFRASR